jgi:hypothetical protein
MLPILILRSLRGSDGFCPAGGWAKVRLQGQEAGMAKVVYEIVEHDGGWAYRVDGTFSEAYPSAAAAHLAACRAALEQQRPGESTGITWEDERGRWHAEIARGDDRPDVEVED